MNCAYHAHNVAVVNCNGCGKPLCPSCDHRIKGFPFCQDCIVSGVELLRSRNQSSYVPYVKRQVSPFVSSVLSLICPGLGAAYNGQTAKGLVHFGVFVGLFQMATLTHSPIFVFGFLGMWLYAAVDAWRTAQIIRSGLTPDAAEDWIVQRFKGNPRLWGIVLTSLGALFILQMIMPPPRYFTRAILPLLFIALGVYLLRGYIFRRNEKALPDFANSASSASAAASNFTDRRNETNFRGGDYGSSPSPQYQRQDEFETQVRSWKSR
jgi:TM2 domain-containing membrane protein YozV